MSNKGEIGKSKPFKSAVNVYKNYRLEIGMILVLAVIMVAMQIATGYALKERNILNIFQAATPYLIMAMGQLLIVITGGIDLSVGSVFSLSGMIGTLVLKQNGILAGMAAALAVGLLCGLINGLLVAKVKMAPFIVTLAMYGTASSLTYILAGGNSQTIKVEAFKLFDRGRLLFDIPNYIVYMLLMTIIMHLILKYTVFGRSLYATGSNEQAAKLVGVPTDRIKMMAYVITGVFCGLAAMLNASYLMTVECSAGSGMELTVIAATVIGGASLSGGVGTAIGAFIGAIMIATINNSINLMGINSFWSGTVTGVVIIAAVLIGTASAKKRAEKTSKE